MKKTAFFRKVLSVVLSLSMLAGIFAIMPEIEANASSTHYSGYNVRIKITVRNDADGWNDAYIKVYGTDGYNGLTEYGTVTSTFNSIQGSIDEGDDVYDNTFDFGTAFPTEIDIYTDFGGGMTWRCWEADVSVYVNGVNVKNQHIVSESGAFSSSNDHNYIIIDKTNYPYPDEVSVVYSDASDNWLPDEDNFGVFYQQADDDNCSAMARTCAYDQYGCLWYDLPSMSNVTSPSSDTAPFYNYKSGSNYKYYYYALTSNLGTDHTSRYKCSYTTENTLYPTKDYTFDAEFIFLHKADITVNDEVVSTIKNYTGAFANIDVAPPAGYTVKSYTLTGSGNLAYDDTDGTYQYTFGASDGVIKATLKANTYKLVFNKNSDTATGSMTQKTLTYDKSLKLPSNMFSNGGYHFTGWNTKADGTGDSYSNLEFVKNLTTENGGTVTFYAQWEMNVYNVTLVYPSELGIASNTVNVAHGGTVSVESIIPGETAGGHYRLTTPASSLANITSTRTINLAYEFVEHNYGAPNVTVAPTCTADGEQEETCLDCGYVKTTVIPHSHQGLVTHAAVPATCVDTGLTEETYCEACDSVVVPAAVVPALGHDYYDPEWEWADDYSWAKATWTCKRCSHQETRQTLYSGEINHSDVGADRVFNTYFNFNGAQYYGAATYHNLYVEVPYIDENGNNATMYAARLSEDSDLVGTAFFVEGEVNLSDTLLFEEDIKLILCDGASLNIESENDGIRLYNSYSYDKYSKDLAVYGQTNQTGELNITVESDASANGIYCGHYSQYGGKVTINCDAVDPAGFPGEANAIFSSGFNKHGSKIEIHNGELTAHSETAEALFCYHHDIIIDGGKVIATTGDSNDPAILCYDTVGSIVLGCRDENDSIYADSYMFNAQGYYSESTLSVVNGQTLTDGDFHSYSGVLTSEQMAAIGGKTLTLHTVHTYVPVWTWSADNDFCTASFDCTVCSTSHEVNATISEERLNLKSVLTATVEFEGDTYTTTKTVTRNSNLFIGGVTVTADNASDILGDGKVSYDEATNTLTLDNATIEVSRYNSEAAFGIRNNMSHTIAFNIVLIGENKIVDLVTNEGVGTKYGICTFASTPGYSVSGSGSLSIEMSATDSTVTYYGIHARKAVYINGADVSISIPGTSKTLGIDLMYSDTSLNVTNNGKLSVSTGSNAETYSVSHASNVVNLKVEAGCLFEASSGHLAFNSNIKPDAATKATGAFVNTDNSYAGSSEWDGETALSTYKYIRIPHIIDVNEDGELDLNDIGFIISASAGLVDMTSSQLAKADLNGDGAVDAFDAAWLDRYLS